MGTISRTTEGNDVSIRVLERLGFKKIATGIRMPSNDSDDGADYTVVSLRDYELILDMTKLMDLAYMLPTIC